MNDGKIVNNAIREYVAKVINIYYASDDEINKDEKLQRFFE